VSKKLCVPALDPEYRCPCGTESPSPCHPTAAPIIKINPVTIAVVLGHRANPRRTQATITQQARRSPTPHSVCFRNPDPAEIPTVKRPSVSAGRRSCRAQKFLTFRARRRCSRGDTAHGRYCAFVAANEELDGVIRKVLALHKKRGLLDNHKLARLTAASSERITRHSYQAGPTVRWRRGLRQPPYESATIRPVNTLGFECFASTGLKSP
jgi:hypothetical protein